ncbi:MAG: D-sedoheptulose 7-phosphate isomerase [Bdellovibrionaceae bacterium]|nr:D-sedoheptulose 7-phosphate isomerase [Pseudobdellovibrionaceae bacterium]
MSSKTQLFWLDSLNEAQKTLNAFIADTSQLTKCEKFSKLLIDTYSNNGNVFTCGNGGSHCDAMHFAEEMTGKYRKNRRALGALALGDPSHTTCVSNDYGFEFIFSRQLEGLARKNDLLIGLSTSGNSQNVINAIKKAKDLGVKTVGLLGKDGGEMLDLVDLAIVIPGKTADRIQEMHIKLLHTVIETVERELFPENYRD